MIAQRYLHEWEGKNERRSVVLPNLAILVIMVVASLTIGLRTHLPIQLPKVLQWFTGNIGLHHVHHERHGMTEVYIIPPIPPPIP